MNASSSDACSCVSSWSTMVLVAASSPTAAHEMPCSESTDSSPSSESVTVTPSTASASERNLAASGVRTRTASPDASLTKPSTVESAIKRPRPTTISQSAIMLISLIRWDETKTVRPSAASERSRLRIQRMPSGSSPLDGSSRISVFGSPSRAAAIPRRCPMPRENEPDPLVGHVLQPDEGDHLVDAAARNAVRLGERDEVRVRGPARVDRARLQDRADLPQGRRVIAIGLAVDRRRASRRAVEAEDHAHGRRLAGSVRAEEAGDHAGPHGEGELIDGELVAVGLREIAHFDHLVTPVGSRSRRGHPPHAS